MSKQLSIIRHAKSDWATGGRDFDRVINGRGYQDTKLIGNYLMANKQQFDRVYCSSAKRAKLTLEQLNTCLGLLKTDIQFEESLYLASLTHLVPFVEKISNQYEHVALIAHNPGLMDLCNFLTGDQLSNLPTCSVYAIDFEVDDWRAVGLENGIKKTLVTPRMLKDD